MNFIVKIKNLKLFWKVFIVWAIATIIDLGLVIFFHSNHNKQPFLIVASFLFLFGIAFSAFYCFSAFFKVIKKKLVIDSKEQLKLIAIFLILLMILMLFWKYGT